MAAPLLIGTPRALALQESIQNELSRREYSGAGDTVMAEYITIMLINGKTHDQINGELEDLIGSSYDSSFTSWLFEEKAKFSRPDPEPEPERRPSPERYRSRERDEPPPIQPQEPQAIPRYSPGPSTRRGGMRGGAPLLQHALHGVGMPAQKRTSSMRSPSPGGQPHKMRRIAEPPTGPRAMRDGPPPRSLLERVGPPQMNGPMPMNIDPMQAAVDTMGGPGPMPMNPMAMQEMLATQMALMSQMAMSMGVLPPQGFMGAPGMPPMAPGPFAGPPGAGRPLRGRGGPPGTRGRGRGGFTNAAPHGGGEEFAMPQPVAAAPAPAATIQPPARPASPSICKFGVKCTNAQCRYSHPSPVATAESGVVLSTDACEAGIACTDKDCIKSHTSPAAAHAPASGSTSTPAAAPTGRAAIPCKFGDKCTRPGCAFQHPRDSKGAVPCRFGTACTRADCPFQHPAGRSALPSTFHRGLSSSTPAVAVPTPTFHASPHKSMSFRPDPNAKPFVPSGSAAATPAVEAKPEEPVSVAS